jgi:ketosteroid isomerase-like protein
VTVISELITANLLSVFGERDGSKRLATMADIYTDDVTFADHDGVVSGREAISAKVETLLARTPGFVFSVAGVVHEVQDLGSLDWNFGPEGQEPVVSGTDIVTVREGRIATLHAYLRSS